MYSVARTLMLSSACVLPSGSVIVALVPRLNINVAWRLPSMSVSTLPCATWIAALLVRSTVVTCGSSAIITASSIQK